MQALLTAHVKGHRRGERTANTSPLSGKVYDAHGSPLIASHACKGSRRYRYYISSPQSCGRTLRIPATELEASVSACLARALANPLELVTNRWADASPAQFAALSHRAAEPAPTIRQAAQLRTLVSEVRVYDDHLVVECDSVALATALNVRLPEAAPSMLTLRSQVSVRRSGMSVRLVHSSGAPATSAPSTPLIRLIIKGRRWWSELRSGNIDITRLAEREGVTASYMTRVVRLAFLSPAVVKAIVAGSAKAQVDAAMLMETGTIVPSWAEQARRLLPAP